MKILQWGDFPDFGQPSVCHTYLGMDNLFNQTSSCSQKTSFKMLVLVILLLSKKISGHPARCSSKKLPPCEGFPGLSYRAPAPALSQVFSYIVLFPSSSVWVTWGSRRQIYFIWWMHVRNKLMNGWLHEWMAISSSF